MKLDGKFQQCTARSRIHNMVDSLNILKYCLYKLSVHLDSRVTLACNYGMDYVLN